MEDREIIRLYQKRDEQAIAASRSKYGAFLYGIAMNILHQNQDAEECESDTYHNAWRHIPPDNPWALRAYLGKITRRLSISRYRKNHAEKRNSELELLVEELDQCIPDSSTPEQELEAKELGEIISDWLLQLPEQQKKLFVRRYWFGSSNANGGSNGIGNVYDLYDGPVMALEVQGDSGGVTVTREVILDFSPYQTREVAAADGTLYNSYEKMAYVSDNYVLTNPADSPITLELAYPVLVWANELSGGALTLLADGETLQPAYGSSRVAVEGGSWSAVGNLLTDEADKALAMSREGLDDDTGEYLYYARFQVTVPANGTLELSAQMEKAGSWMLDGDTDGGYRGYEILPTLGSSLNFQSVQVTLKNYEHIAITDQNCGLELTRDVTSVELNPKEPEYYINVTKK